MFLNIRQAKVCYTELIWVMFKEENVQCPRTLFGSLA